jgi:predicted ATPase/transcriptional regulator with XRE-family HTH domain
MDTPLAFGEWLRRRRKSRDLTQGQLAKRIHCSLTTIKRIEAGNLIPSRQLSELLAPALSVPSNEQSAFISFARTPNATASVDAYREAPPTPPPAKRFQMPTPLTGLIGREREMQAACELFLRPGVRLITLTGPPGTGKTRLGLAMARQLESQFRDGACFVPLAPISDPALVVSAIALALDIHESSGKELLAVVREFLRDKHLVLVLDNFEQVLSAAPVITGLLNAAREVKAIITSRTVLQVYGEYEFPVPPLQLPDIRHLPPLTALEQYSAIELLVERAQAVQPRFELAEANARTVAEICAWLDGLPLAIEMAAAQIRWHTPPVLLAQLKSRLETLTGGPLDLTPRQQTLRGAIAWSHDLLTTDERDLFNHLAVFVESWTAQAAAAVWASHDSQRVRVLLRGLVDQSLLRVEIRGDSADRFSMLETIREFAQEQLQTRGNLDAARQRHADYFLQRLEELSPYVRGGNERQIATLAEIDADYANYRAAMQWAIESARDATRGLRFAAALHDYWETRGYFSQAQQLELAASARATEPSSLRAQVLAGASLVTRWLGDQPHAMALLQEAIATYEILRDEDGLAFTLQHLGIQYGMQRDYADAAQQFQRALEIYRRVNKPDPLASTLGNLGLALFHLNEHTRAKETLTEALSVNRELGDLNAIAHNLENLARIARAQADWECAENLLREALFVFKQIGHQRSIGHTLMEMGEVMIERGRHSDGVRLMAVAKTIHAAIGMQIDARTAQEYQVMLDEARHTLGHAEVERLIAEGTTMNLDVVWASLQLT